MGRDTNNDALQVRSRNLAQKLLDRGHCLLGRLGHREVRVRVEATHSEPRVVRSEPLLSLDGLRMSKRRMFFTSAKAQRELGFVARPYIEGLRDAVDWVRKAGYVR